MVVPGLDPGIVPAIHAAERNEVRRLTRSAADWPPSNCAPTWMLGTSPGTTESVSPTTKISAYQDKSGQGGEASFEYQARVPSSPFALSRPFPVKCETIKRNIGQPQYVRRSTFVDRRPPARRRRRATRRR